MIELSIINLNNVNFKSLISKSDKPVLIECWSNWCAPCKMQLPAIKALAEELHEIAIITKLNVEEYPELADHFSVMSLPTLIVLKDGKELGRKTGFISLLKLKEILNTFGLTNNVEYTL